MSKLKKWFPRSEKWKASKTTGNVWLVTRYNFNFPPQIDVFDNHDAAKAMYDYCSGRFDIVMIDIAPVLSGFEVA